jgi:RNA polymerase sigma factor (sigma-70 family)
MATAQLGTLLRRIQELAAGHAAPQRTDRQLLDDFSAGCDQAAFTALVARHGPMVLRVCRRVLHHEQDAEDAFQATFLVLARHTASIRRREALACWLHGVAYRTAMKAKRSAARRRTHEARVGDLTPPSAPNPSWNEVQVVLDEELGHLPEPFRAAFVLRVLEDRSGSEAAAELGCKESTVASRLRRARHQLQRRLASRGIKLAALLAALSLAENAGKAAVPASLAHATVRSGLLVATGQSTAGVIPSHVAALAAGVTRTMFLTKARTATTFLFALGFLTAAGALAHQALAARETPAVGSSQAAAQSSKSEEKARPVTEGDVQRDTALVSGRVLDPDGKPVQGAKVYFVRLLAYRRGTPPAPPPARATTGADGRFHFRVSRTGFHNAEEKKAWFHVTLTAVAAGHGPAWKMVVEPKALRNVTLKLVKDDVPLVGRVVDLEGKPIKGVTVRILSFAANDHEDLKPWVEALQTKKEVYSFHYPRTTLDPAVVGLTQSVVSGADGKFRLTGIGRERLVELRFEGPTIETHDEYAMTRPAPTIQVPRQKDGPESGVSVFHGSRFEHAAAPTQPIVGTVRDKDTGKAMAGVIIQARLPQYPYGSEPHHSVRTTSDRDGRYRLVGLGKIGERLINALPAAGTPYLASVKTAGQGPAFDPVQVDFELKRGVRIHGRVIDKATGKPVRAQVEYFVFADNPHLREAPGFRGTGGIETTSGDDGSFTLIGMPGRGLITAQHGDQDHYITDAGREQIKGAGAGGEFITWPHICMPNRYHALVEINPAPDADDVTCAVALDPGKTITGTIVGPDGKPVEKVSIEGSWQMPRSYRQENLPTAQFTLPAINPKNPRPFFFHHRDKHLGAGVLFTGDEPTPVTVRLQKCATLTGRVVDEEGQPRANVNVVGNILEGQLGLTRGWYGFLWATTDKDGRFRIEQVLPGVKVGLAIQRGAAITGRLIPELMLKAGETRDLGELKAKEVQ